MTECVEMMDRHGTIIIDVSDVSHINDMIPILKAILIWKGFGMQTIDDVFDRELKELGEE